MHDYCAFSKDHKCIKWEDYQIMLQEIEEADSLCHGNWIEIEKQWVNHFSYGIGVIPGSVK